MTVSSILKKAFWPLVGVGAAYIGCLSLLINPWLQRNAIYMNKFQLTWNYNLTKPEHFGFASIVPNYLSSPGL